jgi:pimeloyl-ACP methyl ester carboxylesterase
MADDAEAVVHALGLHRYVLVGHSMGGKVAQIVATRRPKELLGMVLVAPAPPTPMPVPENVSAGMLEQYSSRAGALEALAILGGESLSSELREQVIEDTLHGALDAKRVWTERNMIEDVSDRAV